MLIFFHYIVQNPNEELVTVESFANILEWFGPVSNGQDLLDKVIYLLIHPKKTKNYSLIALNSRCGI